MKYNVIAYFDVKNCYTFLSWCSICVANCTATPVKLFPGCILFNNEDHYKIKTILVLSKGGLLNSRLEINMIQAKGWSGTVTAHGTRNLWAPRGGHPLSWAQMLTVLVAGYDKEAQYICYMCYKLLEASNTCSHFCIIPVPI